MTQVGGPLVAPSRRQARLVRATTVVLLAVVVVLGGSVAAEAFFEHNETARTTARFDPPVWAGQITPSGCPGGFYARHDRTIVLTISAHCVQPGDTLRDANGHLVGIYGPRAQDAECQIGPFCAPSDFLAMALDRAYIPWGHLNMIDMGAGGYRTLEPGTRPLGCQDISVGDAVEIDGREHYRTGTVTANGPYDFGTDTTFPCMVLGDIAVRSGDSGSSVLVNGEPAGVVSRQFDGRLGFTALAEGLVNLGLTLCTTPDCDLSPASADQPGDQ